MLWRNSDLVRKLALDVLKKSSEHQCQKCHGNNAYVREMHPDTDMNEMVIYCPDCKHHQDIDSRTAKKASEAFQELTNPHPNYVKDHRNCPICGEKSQMSCRCRIGNKSCVNRHGWWTCEEHKKVYVGDSHKAGCLKMSKGKMLDCVCPSEQN